MLPVSWLQIIKAIYRLRSDLYGDLFYLNRSDIRLWACGEPSELGEDAIDYGLKVGHRRLKAENSPLNYS